MTALPANHGQAPTLPLRRRISLAGEILAAYYRARRELRRGDLRQTVATLRRTDMISPADLGARRLAQATTRTLHLVPLDSRCLVLSLVVTRLLARRGIASVFVLGVSPGPDFAAHAWVECDGSPVLPAGDGSFGRLLEL